jgi:DNA ligase 1
MEYKELVKVYEEIGSTSKRLEKVEIISKFLKKVKKNELKESVYLLEGRIFPEWDQRKIGFSSRLMLKALNMGSGETIEYIEDLFQSKGDLGLVAEEIFEKKKQVTLSSKGLESGKVLENIRKLAELEGKGTVDRKVRFIIELLSNAKGKEAKYIVKTVLENLRIGVSSGIIRDSIAKAFDIDVKEIEKVADLNGDYGEVAELAKANNLKAIGLKVGKPVKCMLAILANNVEEGFKALGEPAIFETKIDGFRLQCHGNGKEIKLFTRRMEDVTRQFPDVVGFLEKHIKAKNYILDAEAVGYDFKTKKYLPFQTVSQRIKRKYDIEDMAKKFPIELNVFDVLYCDGKNLMGEVLENRREILEGITKEKKGEVVVTKKLITNNAKKASEFFKKVLSEGFEGLMVKNIKSEYRPGRYVGGWMKLKDILEPLDLVVVKAEYGEGKRAGWLTSFTVACSDGDKFLEVGKVATGVKEKGEQLTYKKMTKFLEPLIEAKKGKEVVVKPKIILEVAYEEIQISTKYSSGFGLRFPRVIDIRIDKSLNELSDLKLVRKIFNYQKGKKQ